VVRCFARFAGLHGCLLLCMGALQKWALLMAPQLLLTIPFAVRTWSALVLRRYFLGSGLSAGGRGCAGGAGLAGEAAGGGRVVTGCDGVVATLAEASGVTEAAAAGPSELLRPDGGRGITRRVLPLGGRAEPEARWPRSPTTDWDRCLASAVCCK